MNMNFHDPAVMISVGVIFVGFGLLIWAINKLRQKAPHQEARDFLNPRSSKASAVDDLFTGRSVDRGTASFSEFAPSPEAPPAKSRPPLPAINKEMMERMDAMTQRLSDMQNLLQRQANNPAAAGTTLTAEAIDKLLKIIGNITQQIDFLHRSMGPPSAETASPAPVAIETISAAAAVANPPPTATKPAGAASTSAPSSPPSPLKPGAKTIGVVGGALSSFPKQNPPTPKSGK